MISGAVHAEIFIKKKHKEEEEEEKLFQNSDALNPAWYGPHETQ